MSGTLVVPKLLNGLTTHHSIRSGCHVGSQIGQPSTSAKSSDHTRVRMPLPIMLANPKNILTDDLSKIDLVAIENVKMEV